MHVGYGKLDSVADWHAAVLATESRRTIDRLVSGIPAVPSAAWGVVFRDEELVKHVENNGGKAVYRRFTERMEACEAHGRMFRPGETATCTICGMKGEHLADFGPRIMRGWLPIAAGHAAAAAAVEMVESLAPTRVDAAKVRLLRAGTRAREGWTQWDYPARQNACRGCRREAAATRARAKAR